MRQYLTLFMVLFGLLLLGATVVFLSGHGENLLGGFSSLPKERKAKFDKPALCRFVGKVLLPFDALFFAIVVGVVTDAPWTERLGFLTGLVGGPFAIAMAVYANTGGRFMK